MNLTDYNEIRELLIRHGFRFSKAMGQNFLTAAWVPQRIADEAGLDEQTGVLEIGPGVGCLTRELSERAGKVLSVELDKSLMGPLSETLTGCDNVEVLFSDVLKEDISALVDKYLAPLRPVVCANLPYNVTTPLLTAIIEAGRFDTVTVMIQREAARRICAKAGESDYGAFGIFVQWYMDCELLFDVPPDCFMPRPKVTSSVIRLTRRDEKSAEVRDEKLMFRVIRAAFNQRRKTLVNALSSNFKELEKPQIEKIIENCGFNNKIRGENLDVVAFAKISDEIGNIITCDL